MWKKKTSNIRSEPATLKCLITEMINFFDGFEYGDTILCMSRQDYKKHFAGMVKRNGMLYFASIPVYIDEELQPGAVKLDSIYNLSKGVIAA